MWNLVGMQVLDLILMLAQVTIFQNLFALDQRDENFESETLVKLQKNETVKKLQYAQFGIAAAQTFIIIW